MTQIEHPLAPAVAPPFGTEIELDGRVYVVTEPDDSWLVWYIRRQRLVTPVYLVERDGEGEWTVEGAAHIAEYGTVLA